MVHASWTYMPDSTVRNRMTAPALLTLLDFMSASSASTALAPLWIRYTKGARQPKNKTRPLRQTVVGIPYHWNCRIEIQGGRFQQRYINQLTQAERKARRKSEERRAGGRNWSRLDGRINDHWFAGEIRGICRGCRP